jgi:predicted HTH transcriptional regulator
MIEITSPGKLSPSVDYNDMEARQSEIRNRVIAPFFKHLGLIDQWGNGLKLIADELREYNDIELKWHDKGLQFQIQFLKTNDVEKTKKNNGLVDGLVENQKRWVDRLVENQNGLAESQRAILKIVEKEPSISKKKMAAIIGISTTALDKNIAKLKQKGLLQRVGAAKGGHWETIIPESE